MLRELRQTLQQLSKNKLTERKNAFDEIGRWMSINAAKVDNNEDWAEVFDALKVGVTQEHNNYAKKGASNANQGRLESISGSFRKVIESSVPHLNNITIDALVKNTVKIMRFEGALIEATGCNYAKALLSIISHPAHLRALDDTSWLAMSIFSWAHLLNEKIPDKQAWAEEDPKLSAYITSTFDGNLKFAFVTRYLTMFSR
jgi:ataxia telangiectasia mutated family protein